MKLKLISLSLVIAFAPSWAQSAEWDYPATYLEIDNRTEAQTYLEENYASEGEFRFRYKTKSKLGEHYNFDILVAGEYQPQRTIILTINHEQRVIRVFKSFEDTMVRNGKPIVAARDRVPPASYKHSNHQLLALVT